MKIQDACPTCGALCEFDPDSEEGEYVAVELEVIVTRTQGTLSDRTLAFIDLLNHYDSTMRNVMALPSGRTQEQKDRARLALIKAFETRATPADPISQARDAISREQILDLCVEFGPYFINDRDNDLWGLMIHLYGLERTAPEKLAGDI